MNGKDFLRVESHSAIHRAFGHGGQLNGYPGSDKLHKSSGVRAVFSPSFERMPANAETRPDRAEVPFGTQDAALGFSEVTQLASNALSREAQLLQDVRVTRVVAQALQIRVNL
jgi:hypothetical protein